MGVRRIKCEKDRGFAWVVLAASFVSHAFHLGFIYGSLGNFTIAHQAHLKIDPQASNWISAGIVGVLFCFAPLASAMVERFSCQVTQLFGGVCLILGVGLSSLSTELWHACLLFSVLIGCGVSATYMASSTILGQYFNRRKYIAFAVAVLGAYAGTLYWPILSEKFIAIYGYPKAMWIFASLHVVHLISGLLFPTNTSHFTEAETENKEVELENIENEKECQQSSDESKPIGIFGKIKSLMSSWKIWLLLGNSLLWNGSVFTFLVIVNKYMTVEKNISLDEASLGITIYGGADIAGCVGLLIMSIITSNYSRLGLHMIASTVYGVATIIIPFSEGKILYYCMCGLFGVAQGAQIGNLVSVIYDFCGVDKLAVLFGIVMFSAGIGGLIGPPLVGSIQSSAGPDTGFFFCGSAAILASLVMVPVLVHNIAKNRKAATQASEETMPMAEDTVKLNGGEQVEEETAPNDPLLNNQQEQTTTESTQDKAVLL